MIHLTEQIDRLGNSTGRRVLSVDGSFFAGDLPINITTRNHRVTATALQGVTNIWMHGQQTFLPAKQ